MFLNIVHFSIKVVEDSFGPMLIFNPFNVDLEIMSELDSEESLGIRK